MSEFKKREIAYKLRIGDLLRGKPILEQSQDSNRLLFVELGDKKLVRVNIVANVIDKFNSEGERRFASLTLDDASGQIRLRLFGEDILKFESLVQGDTLMIIGLLRSFNNELYILPEIIKKIEPRYLLIRKLEIEKLNPKITSEDKEKIRAFRDQLIEIIKQAESVGGIETDEILNKINGPANIISEEIKRLLEEGIIYEPSPSKLRYLG